MDRRSGPKNLQKKRSKKLAGFVNGIRPKSESKIHITKMKPINETVTSWRTLQNSILWTCLFFVLASSAQSEDLIHTSTSTNIEGHSTYLDMTTYNGNPDALILVSPIWNPGGKGGVYHNHAVGVRYDADKQQWAIFNQDKEAMEPGASFAVVPGNAIHRATPDNIKGHLTYVDFAEVNGQSSSPFQITATLNPAGKEGAYNDHPIGIWYDVERNMWAIFNEDQSPMPVDASFNIRFPTGKSGSGWSFWPDPHVFKGNSVYLTGMPPVKAEPNCVITVTQYWNPGANPNGVYNPHHVGVWYDPEEQTWAVFNQDMAPMPPGVAFELGFFFP